MQTNSNIHSQYNQISSKNEETSIRLKIKIFCEYCNNYEYEIKCDFCEHKICYNCNNYCENCKLKCCPICIYTNKKRNLLCEICFFD